MGQTNCPTSENSRLGRLVADAQVEIERLGYSRRSWNRYRAIWEHLIAFAREKELGDEFSPDLAARFLEEYGVKGGQLEGRHNRWRRHAVFGVKVLADFAKDRRITAVQAIRLIPAMQNTLRDTRSIARIGSTFDRRPFAGVRQISRFFWIFSIHGKGGHWTKFRRRICPSSCQLGIT